MKERLVLSLALLAGLVAALPYFSAMLALGAGQMNRNTYYASGNRSIRHDWRGAEAIARQRVAKAYWDFEARLLVADALKDRGDAAGAVSWTRETLDLAEAARRRSVDLKGWQEPWPSFLLFDQLRAAGSPAAADAAKALGLNRPYDPADATTATTPLSRRLSAALVAAPDPGARAAALSALRAVTPGAWNPEAARPPAGAWLDGGTLKIGRSVTAAVPLAAPAPSGTAAPMPTHVVLAVSGTGAFGRPAILVVTADGREVARLGAPTAPTAMAFDLPPPAPGAERPGGTWPAALTFRLFNDASEPVTGADRNVVIHFAAVE